MTMATRKRTPGKVVAILAVAALALMFAPFQASALPIPGPPTPISATGGAITAIYMFADAGDSSILSQTVPSAISPIFCNHNVGTCVGSSAGATLSLGSPPVGPLVFSLQDFTVPATFFTNASGSDTFSHDLVSGPAVGGAAIATAYAAYGVGAILPGAQTVINALPAGTSLTFIGWEDRLGGDYDYNDLIFAFTNIAVVPPPAPEPATLLLLGAGLVGVAGLGRMRLRRKGTK